MLHGVLIALIVIGGVGCIIGILLGFAGKAFEVPVDEKELAIREILPGANCGSCGYAGCDAMAAAIANGEAPVSGCPVGGDPIAEEIGKIMGQTVDAMERKVAFVRCCGDCEATTDKYTYSGPESCVTLGLVSDKGPKSCSFGCSGLGDCVRACDFDAIHIERGIAVVDEAKCKDCRKCIEACPKGLIIEIPAGSASRVACVNPEKGKKIMNACKQGCIACKKCEKTCEAGAIKVEKGYAEIDYSLCNNCGKCKEVCPRKCII